MNVDPNLEELAWSKALFYTGRVGKELLSKRELEQVKETFVSIIPPVCLSSFGKRDLIIGLSSWKSVFYNPLHHKHHSDPQKTCPSLPQYWDIRGFFGTFPDYAFPPFSLDLFIMYIEENVTLVKTWCWWFEAFPAESSLVSPHLVHPTELCSSSPPVRSSQQLKGVLLSSSKGIICSQLCKDLAQFLPLSLQDQEQKNQQTAMYRRQSSSPGAFPVWAPASLNDGLV